MTSELVRLGITGTQNYVGGNMNRKKANSKRSNLGRKQLGAEARKKRDREREWASVLALSNKNEATPQSIPVYEDATDRVETASTQESVRPPPEPAPVYEGVKVRAEAASTQGSGKPRIIRIPVQRLREDPVTDVHPPLLIGFASEPGGVGCTTLAAHLAYYLAAFKKKNTLACSQDGGLLRFLVPDARFSVDTHWTVAGTSRLAVTYAARIAWDARTRFADLGLPFHPDVIVQDRTLLCMKKADVVIVPVSDFRSERALREGRFSRGAVGTILLGNQDDRESGAPLLRLQYGGLKESQGIYFVQNAIPDSGLLRRSAELGQTVWESAPESYTADCMRAAFGEIGHLINSMPRR